MRMHLTDYGFAYQKGFDAGRKEADARLREDNERMREALKAVSELKRTGFSKARAIDMAADIADAAPSAQGET